jgi:hypothetical protein
LLYSCQIECEHYLEKGERCWPPPRRPVGPAESEELSEFHEECGGLGRHRPAAYLALQSVPGLDRARAAERSGLFRVPGPGRARHRRQRHHPGPEHQRPDEGRQQLLDLRAERPQPDHQAGRDPCPGERRTCRRQHASAAEYSHLLVPDAVADRRLDLLHAPDAVGRRQGHGFRQKPGAAADRKGGPRHLR